MMDASHAQKAAFHSKRPTPSNLSVKGLNSFVFFNPDIRGGLTPVLAIYLTHYLHLDFSKIGVALASLEVSAFISQLPAGYFIDQTNRKTLLIALFSLLNLVGFLLIFSAYHFIQIILALLMIGFSMAFIAPTVTSITLGLVGKEKFPKRAAKNEVYNHTGNVLTNILAGLIGLYAGVHWTFLLFMALAGGCLFSIFFINSQEIDNAAAQGSTIEQTKTPPKIELLLRKDILIFNLSIVLFNIANSSQLFLISQLLAVKKPEACSFYLSACMTISELTIIFMAYFMSRYVNNFMRKSLFLAAFCIVPTRAFLYLWINNPNLYLVLQILDGMTIGIMGSLCGIIISELAHQTGSFNFLLGVAAMATNIGIFCSQLIAGFLAQHFGYSASFLALILFAVCGILVFYFFMPETKKTETQEDNKRSFA